MSRAGGVEQAGPAPAQEWSGAILVNAEGQVLLNLRDASKAFYPNQWDLIGGTVESGETPHQCMLREIQEETGVVIDAVEWLGDFEVPLEDGAFAVLHLFLGELDRPVADLLLGEGQEHRFFGLAEVDRLDIVPGTKAVLNAFAERIARSQPTPIAP